MEVGVFPEDTERQINALVTLHEHEGVAEKTPAAMSNVKLPVDERVTDVSQEPLCRVIVQGLEVQVVNSFTVALSTRSKPEEFEVTEPTRRGAGRAWSRAIIVQRM
jgi:hypothetical protein